MKRIERTKWAREFKRDCPWNYSTAIELASDADLFVQIKRSTEVKLAGEWAIIAGGDFWLDAKPTKREAVTLCHEMGWRISK